MPRPAHGVDRLVGDGLLAALALGARRVHVALLAVRVPLQVVEPRLRSEPRAARPAREARGVPARGPDSVGIFSSQFCLAIPCLVESK